MFYTFKDLTADEINLIGHALGKLPYEVSQPLLAKLQAQISDAELAAKAQAPANITDEAATAD